MIALALLAALGLWLAANHHPTGWALLSIAQALAIPYNLAGDHTAVLLPIALALVGLRNLHHARVMRTGLLPWGGRRR